MEKVQEQTEGAPGPQMRTERQPPVAQSEVKGGSGGGVLVPLRRHRVQILATV